MSEKPTAERLIEVAGEIFAAKGSSATVREICSAAGCSVAAINYYFGDKQNLYIRCVEAACERKQRLFPFPDFESESATAPSDLLREFLRAVARRMAAASNLPWQNTLMLREVLSPSAEVAARLQQYFRPDFDKLSRLLSQLLGNDIDSEKLRQGLATQILARCMFLRTGKSIRLMLGLNSETNEDPELYADEICDSILAQIQALRGSPENTSPTHSDTPDPAAK